MAWVTRKAGLTAPEAQTVPDTQLLPMIVNMFIAVDNKNPNSWHLVEVL